MLLRAMGLLVLVILPDRARSYPATAPATYPHCPSCAGAVLPGATDCPYCALPLVLR